MMIYYCMVFCNYIKSKTTANFVGVIILFNMLTILIWISLGIGINYLEFKYDRSYYLQKKDTTSNVYRYRCKKTDCDCNTNYNTEYENHHPDMLMSFILKNALIENDENRWGKYTTLAVINAGFSSTFFFVVMAVVFFWLCLLVIFFIFKYVFNPCSIKIIWRVYLFVFWCVIFLISLVMVEKKLLNFIDIIDLQIKSGNCFMSYCGQNHSKCYMLASDFILFVVGMMILSVFVLIVQRKYFNQQNVLT